MKKRFLAVSILAVAALSLTACGSKTEETLAYETATAPETTEAEETEEETEAETIDEKEYQDADSIETWFMFEDYAVNNLNYLSSEVPPEVGSEPKKVAYIYNDRDDETLYGHESFMKTVSLPSWGIKQMTVHAALFPESDEKILKLDESKLGKRKLTSDEVEQLKALGSESATEDVEVMSYDGLYLDWADIDVNEKDDYCVDISSFYPGSFTRTSYLGMLQLFNKETDIDLTPEALDDITGPELFEKLYPYGSYHLGQDNEIGVGDFNIFDYDGCKYVWWQVAFNGNKTPVSWGGDPLRGIMLMRIKDGLCEGIFMGSGMTNKNAPYEYTVYSLGRSMQLFDISLDKEGLCTDYLGR